MTTLAICRCLFSTLALARGWWAARCRLAVCVLWAQGAALAADATPTVPPHRLDPATVIKRIQDAADRHSFTGTFVVSAGGAITSLRITHVGDGHNQIDRLETLDGQMRQIYRHNDLVHVLWPRNHTASIEHRDLGLGYPAALQADASARLDMYELQSGGTDRVAGLDAEVLHLRPRDSHRYAQKLWLERQSGLLLRTDILGQHGELIESAGFSELHWDPKLQPKALLTQMHRLKGYRVERPRLVHTDLEREGWILRTPVTGFKALQTYRHPPRLSAAVGNAADPVRPASVEAVDLHDGVVQAVFGDGLTTVSLFVERYDASRHLRESPAASHGATQGLARRQGDWWITAVGDVPSDTLQQFATRMERRKP